MDLSQFVSRVKHSDIGRRMASGAFWSFTGTAAAKFIVLVAGIFCARILGKEQYGEFGMVRSTISMFVTFGMAGMGLTATKFISEYRREFPQRISSIYMLTTLFSAGLGVIISAAIIICAPFIATQTLSSPYLTSDLRWGGILLFFTILNGVQNGTLSGFEDFRSIAINTFWGSIAESVLMCVGAYWYGVTGAIIGFGSGFIVIYALNKYSIGKWMRDLKFSWKISAIRKDDLSIIYKFSIPGALSSLLVAPVYWIVRSMLVKSDGYGELGIFEAADQWKTIILFIPMAVSQIVLPILSSIVNVDKTKFWRVLNLSLALNGSLSLVMALLVGLCSESIMMLYGSSFDSATPLVMMAFSTVFSALSNVIGLSIYSRAKMWIGFLFNLIWAAVMLMCSYILLGYGWGATGIAFAILCSYAVLTVSQYIYIRVIA